ncbi:hypothetical protein ACFSEO_18935 [Agromyces cerinus subsp. nitratus]
MIPTGEQAFTSLRLHARASDRRLRRLAVRRGLVARVGATSSATSAGGAG